MDANENWILAPYPHVHSGNTTHKVMRDVLIALVPAVIAAVWWFGARVLLVVGISAVSAMLFEGLFQKLVKKRVAVFDLSAAVTGLLIGMCMPVGVSWWVPLAGSFFGIVIVKQLFGGLGKNVVNPALAARAFLLASWPARMTVYDLPAGIDAVTAATTHASTHVSGAVDAVSAATPLVGGEGYSLFQMFIGQMPGCIGEVSKAALLIGAAYLLLRRVIFWRIPVVMLGVVALLSFLFPGKGVGVELLSGGLVMAAFFMATDYTTSPAAPWGQVLYAAGCAIITFAIRRFGSFPEGVTYGILVMNLFVPLINQYIRVPRYGMAKKRRRAHA